MIWALLCGTCCLLGLLLLLTGRILRGRNAPEGALPARHRAARWLRLGAATSTLAAGGALLPLLGGGLARCTPPAPAPLVVERALGEPWPASLAGERGGRLARAQTGVRPQAGMRAGPAPPPREPARLQRLVDRLRPLHRPLTIVRPGDWLSQHREPGQTFAEYLKAGPVTAHGVRRVLYLQPIGAFTRGQRRILDLAAEFMTRFFCLPVRVARSIPQNEIPSGASRTHPTWGGFQILTTWVLDRILLPRLPDDAAAYLALTATDLWPGPGWNFVFGQASLSNRVGVWSIHRNGNPDRDEAGFRLCLLRTIKTAVHETGHMFSMQHCIRYECLMCGSNHREEADRRPLPLCPECLAKVLWATSCDPVTRYRNLLELCRINGLQDQARRYEALLQATLSERGS